MKKKLLHHFVWQGLLACSLLIGCSDLSHTDVATDSGAETVVIPDEEYTEGYTDLYKVLNPEVHSLEALRGRWIQKGLKEEVVDDLIKSRNGWEGK